MPSAEERFRAKVKRLGGHDVWTGSRDDRGVGMVRIDGKLKTVQRAAWEFAYGPLEDGARVNTCAVERACVTLGHLSLATPTSRPVRRRRQKGSGSLREVGDGTWEIGVTDRSCRSGRRYITVHGSRVDAEHALADALDATQRQELGDLRIGELVRRFITATDGAPVELMLVSDVIQPLLGDDLAALATPLRIERALDRAARESVERADARDALRLLRRGYQWAMTLRWCDRDPTAEIDTRWLGRRAHSPLTLDRCPYNV